MSGDDATPSRGQAVAALWCVVLVLACVRATSNTEVFPWWDLDPMRIEAMSSGIRPTGSVAIDVAMIAASAGVVLLSGAGLAWWVLAAMGAGLATMLYHGLVRGGGDLEQLRTGSCWAGACSAGIAAWAARGHVRVARLTIAVVLGLVALLAAKGLVQVYVEHPATVAQYRADNELFLESQGWLPGSSSARNFERRLTQAEATGWFGLSNVLASVAAAALVGLVGLLLAGLRREPDGRRHVADGWIGVVALGSLAAGVCLWLTHSKGGLTVAAIGLALLAGRMLLSRPAMAPVATRLTPRAAGLLGVALVLSALLALVVRGAVGERVGELSLLFRWFYIRGAWNIWASHPVLGVGPAGFKDAYLVAKPAISPEEVMSPHSVLWDLGACLGAGGLALAGLVVASAFAAGRGFAANEVEPASAIGREDRRMIALVVCAACIAGAFVERAVGTPESALLRVVGLVGWLGLSMGVLEVVRATLPWRWAASLMALVVLVHGQVEVTPVWAGSASLWAIIVATGAGAGFAHFGDARSSGVRRSAGSCASVAMLSAAAIGVLGLPGVAGWERGLRDAAEIVRPFARLSERLRLVGTPQRRTGDDMPRIAADVGALLGEVPARDPRGLDLAMGRLQAAVASRAEGPLRAALSRFPTHTATAEAICRLLLQRAYALSAQGMVPRAEEDFAEAIAIAKALVARAPGVAANHGLLASMLDAQAGFHQSPDGLERAVEALKDAAALDPFGTTFPMRLARTEAALRRMDEARSWARKALDLDRGLRLDPLRQMSDRERAEMERLASEP
ncbi:MAG: tetratricopeptide repeat protein [Phycisphaerae bacterium]|nr:tetratricopeptide repeat protein [Phycisphaerae bacterium]